MQRQKTGCKIDGRDNRIPEDVPECRGTNSPTPTSPKIRYILLPSFIQAIYEVKFTLKTGKKMKKWTARSSGPTLSPWTPFKDGSSPELTAAGSIIHHGHLRQPHARLGHGVDSALLEQQYQEQQWSGKNEILTNRNAHATESHHSHTFGQEGGAL